MEVFPKVSSSEHFPGLAVRLVCLELVNVPLRTCRLHCCFSFLVVAAHSLATPPKLRKDFWRRKTIWYRGDCLFSPFWLSLTPLEQSAQASWYFGLSKKKKKKKSHVRHPRFLMCRCWACWGTNGTLKSNVVASCYICRICWHDGVCTHAKRSRTHDKDTVVHVRILWIMEMLK